MSTVAIICEYNPFHNGHKYQVDEIRREFGEDTTIIAIMSGNFTQRGDIAIADKALRARCAVDAGINLCLELPFPFSMSSAEIFAKSAVYIADRLGVVDYLSFGSESGDIALLKEAADAMSSSEYQEILSQIIAADEYKGVGYPRLCEIALKATCGEGKSDITMTPNNILALEYIKALKQLNSRIKPHTIKRLGADYNEEEILDTSMQSATAIRGLLTQNHISALEYIPNSSKEHVLSAMADGSMPCDQERIASAVIANLRLNYPGGIDNIHDTMGGLYNRLEEASLEASTIQDLVRITATKKFTLARVKRVIWYSFFGVTSSEIKTVPMYTQVLAMDQKGRYELKKIKKGSDFPVLTKPSNISSLPDDAKAQKAFSDRADAIFQMTKPIPPHAGFALKFTPYVKTDE